jgi:hypothetical protein
MNKVYFDTEKKHWFVNEPEDFYAFKSVNYQTKEEQNQILSWTRGYDLQNYPKHIRMYDVEINEVKYFFLMRKDDTHYVIESEDPIALESLIEKENIFFTGETLS